MTFNREQRKKILLSLLAIVIALFSFFYLGDKYSNPESFSKYISILDEKKANVMGLTASTSAASIAITAIPDDIGTPIASQLADLSGYLLIILTVIYLEKYLLTVIGFGVFKVVIPITCALFIGYQLRPNNFSLKKAALKIGIFAIALFFLIPTSVSISHMIDETYQQSINQTLSNTNQTIEVEEPIQKQEEKQDLKWYEKIYNAFTNALEDVKQTVTSSTSAAIEKAKNMLSNFIEATAVMIVTSCVIPILTVLVFLWLTKIILGIEIQKPNLIEFKNRFKKGNGNIITVSENEKHDNI